MKFKTFGEWLRHQRLQKEISPFRMAEALGYKRVSAIYNFEYAIAPLPISKWRAMASVLQISIEDFLKVMVRYNPDKVAEFKQIRGAGEGPTAGPGPNSFRPSVRTETGQVPPPSDAAREGRVRAYRLLDAEAVFVAPEGYEDSLIFAVEKLRRVKGWRLGLLTLAEDWRTDPWDLVAALKETKMLYVLEPEGEDGAEWAVSNSIKAVFLDALTGAEGLPEIHRVPKIFSVGIPPLVEPWTSEKVEAVLQYVQENGRHSRRLYKAANLFSESANSR